MTEDATQLYREVLLAWSRREAARLPSPTRSSRVSNPFCGDRVTFDVRLDGDRLQAVGYEAKGCIVTKASAAMLVDALRERAPADAEQLCRAVEAALHDHGAPVPAGLEALVEPLRAAAALPGRTRCATLPWEAAANALAE